MRLSFGVAKRNAFQRAVQQLDHQNPAVREAAVGTLLGSLSGRIRGRHVQAAQNALFRAYGRAGGQGPDAAMAAMGLLVLSTSGDNPELSRMLRAIQDNEVLRPAPQVKITHVPRRSLLMLGLGSRARAA